MKVVIIILFMVILSLVEGCSENGTKPPDDNGPNITSHNFVWRYDTLGTYGSILRDVAFINENDIWAVGEIRTPETGKFDSLGNWTQHFNAAHWNGDDWSLKRIKTNACGGVLYPPIEAVFSFSAIDVWFSHGGSVTHFNGESYINDCSINSDLQGAIKILWGGSLDNLYGIGGNGFVAHHIGNSWTKLISGTNIPLYDISGKGNKTFITGYDDAGEGIVLLIDDLHVSTLFHSNNFLPDIRNNDYGLFRSVGIIGDTAYFASMAGFIKMDIESQNFVLDSTLANRFQNTGPISISGNAANDIMLFGETARVLHFNGKDWWSQNLRNHFWEIAPFRLTSGVLHNNFAIGVGYHLYGNYAVIVIGERAP